MEDAFVKPLHGKIVTNQGVDEEFLSDRKYSILGQQELLGYFY